MKILKDETSFMRDNVPALDVDVTAVVSPTYKKAIEDRERIRARIKKELKDKEVRNEPILGTKADKLTLGESLFEDVESEKLDEALIEVDDDEIVDMLMNRLEEYWHPDKETYDLYEKMYQNYLDGGVFEGSKLNLAEIVDNDWVNYCDVISEGDDDFEKVVELYKDGNYDISEETIYSFVEAVNDEENPTLILVRH